VLEGVCGVAGYRALVVAVVLVGGMVLGYVKCEWGRYVKEHPYEEGAGAGV
jgi:hypothetical protein